MPMLKETKIKARKEVFEDAPRVQRVDTGMKVKQTGPGVMTVRTSNPPPSRPQNKERMGVGGSKATQRPKGRTDPKAANAMDPGAFPMASTKVNWPTSDPKAKKGYVVGKAWPTRTVQGAGPNPYRSEANENNPTQAEGANAQDMDGPA